MVDREETESVRPPTSVHHTSNERRSTSKYLYYTGASEVDVKEQSIYDWDLFHGHPTIKKTESSEKHIIPTSPNLDVLLTEIIPPDTTI